VRVLLITQRLPYAPNRGDRLRAYHEIRQLRAAEWTVDVLALVHDPEEASHVDEMRRDGLNVEVAIVPSLLNKVRGLALLAGARPLTLTLLDSPEMPRAAARLLARARPDVVLAFSSSMAAFALRAPLAGLPFVLDFVDVDSEKWRALAASARWPMSWIYRREHRTLQAFEARAARAAHANAITTPREREALLAFAPDVRVDVVPNGIDLQRFARPAAVVQEHRVVFTGVMNYEPNADAALWLCREIWPLVRRTRPDASLDIVGATPNVTVQGLQDRAQGITVTGSVPDVRPYLWRARVAVAPLRVARGVQNKVLEAAAAGLPSVVSPAVDAGLPEVLRGRCPIARTAGEFAESIVRFLNATPAPDEWAEAVASLDWGQALAPLDGLLHEAAAQPKATYPIAMPR